MLSFCSTNTRRRVLTFRHLNFFFSFGLNLNVMSDFEAVAKLLKVCQWVSASELKDTLRLAEQRGRRGPQHPASQRRRTSVRVRATDKLKRAKGRHLHCSAMNNSSGSQSQRCYTPSLPGNRGGVCVCKKGKGAGGSTEVKEREVRKWRVVSTL